MKNLVELSWKHATVFSHDCLVACLGEWASRKRGESNGNRTESKQKKVDTGNEPTAKMMLSRTKTTIDDGFCCEGITWTFKTSDVNAIGDNWMERLGRICIAAIRSLNEWLWSIGQFFFRCDFAPLRWANYVNFRFVKWLFIRHLVHVRSAHTKMIYRFWWKSIMKFLFKLIHCFVDGPTRRWTLNDERWRFVDKLNKTFILMSTGWTMLCQCLIGIRHKFSWFFFCRMRIVLVLSGLIWVPVDVKWVLWELENWTGAQLIILKLVLFGKIIRD